VSTTVEVADPVHSQAPKVSGGTHDHPQSAQTTSIMPASLRIEVFPSNMKRFLDFYINVLHFNLKKHEGSYAYLNRDDIFIGAIEVPNSDTQAEKEGYRRPTKGVEIVFEVDDLQAERDRIVAHGCKLEDDIKMQEWSLEDFRLVDPDGYYIRITTHPKGH
jgi:lactoylglutathione lyase